MFYTRVTIIVNTFLFNCRVWMNPYTGQTLSPLPSPHSPLPFIPWIWELLLLLLLDHCVMRLWNLKRICINDLMTTSTYSSGKVMEWEGLGGKGRSGKGRYSGIIIDTCGIFCQQFLNCMAKDVIIIPSHSLRQWQIAFKMDTSCANELRFPTISNNFQQSLVLDVSSICHFVGKTVSIFN